VPPVAPTVAAVGAVGEAATPGGSFPHHHCPHQSPLLLAVVVVEARQSLPTTRLGMTVVLEQQPLSLATMSALRRVSVVSGGLVPRLQCVGDSVNTSDKRAVLSRPSSRPDWVSPQELLLVVAAERVVASRTLVGMCSGAARTEVSSSRTLWLGAREGSCLEPRLVVPVALWDCLDSLQGVVEEGVLLPPLGALGALVAMVVSLVEAEAVGQVLPTGLLLVLVAMVPMAA
jgi:hypothetical protein